MIINTDQIIALLKTVDGITDVFRSYPDIEPTAPFATVSVISNITTLTADDEETIADMTYQVDLYHEDPAEAEDMASAMSSLLSQYGIMRVGYFDGFEPLNGLRRVTISFRAVLDKRGNTYTY